jgi:hypothetical protein
VRDCEATTAAAPVKKKVARSCSPTQRDVGVTQRDITQRTCKSHSAAPPRAAAASGTATARAFAPRQEARGGGARWAGPPWYSRSAKAPRAARRQRRRVMHPRVMSCTRVVDDAGRTPHAPAITGVPWRSVGGHGRVSDLPPEIPTVTIRNLSSLYGTHVCPGVSGLVNDCSVRVDCAHGPRYWASSDSVY